MREAILNFGMWLVQVHTSSPVHTEMSEFTVMPRPPSLASAPLTYEKCVNKGEYVVFVVLLCTCTVVLVVVETQGFIGWCFTIFNYFSSLHCCTVSGVKLVLLLAFVCQVSTSSLYVLILLLIMLIEFVLNQLLLYLASSWVLANFNK